MKLALVCVVLTGCDLVFDLSSPDPGEQVCAGNSPVSLSRDCATVGTELVGASIDTGALDDPDDTGDCDFVIEQSDLDATELCVIAADDIVISATVAIGSRPLMLMAVHDLVVSGSLEAGSRRDREPGPGANHASCATDLDGDTALIATSAGGGGAGGSFQRAGGDGGDGNGGQDGGAAAGGDAMFGFIRGGCAGGSGGQAGNLNGIGGLAGDGGGAIYLVAGGTITIDGLVDASGAGGQGGTHGLMDGGGGGGGGGSGGLIALDAPTIVLSAGSRLIANGGGGGGGGSSNMTDGSGEDGETADPAQFPFVAAGGLSIGGGDGGNGATRDDPTGQDGQIGDAAGGAAGGGGGGGTGFILAFGALDDRGAEASPAVDDR